MPRARKGPSGPKSSAGGKGTGSQPRPKGPGSGKTKSNMTKPAQGSYGSKSY